MKLLLDECLPYSLASALRSDGHDCVHVYDHALAGRPDRDVMAAARDEGRVLLSADTDFGEILATSGARLPSVIISRMVDLRASTLRRILALNLDDIAEALQSGALVVISGVKIRLRTLPI